MFDASCATNICKRLDEAKALAIKMQDDKELPVLETTLECSARSGHVFMTPFRMAEDMIRGVNKIEAEYQDCIKACYLLVSDLGSLLDSKFLRSTIRLP